MCQSKGNPFAHVRNCWIPFMESIAGLIELKTYHDDARRTEWRVRRQTDPHGTFGNFESYVV